MACSTRSSVIPFSLMESINCLRMPLCRYVSSNNLISAASYGLRLKVEGIKFINLIFAHYCELLRNFRLYTFNLKPYTSKIIYASHFSFVNFHLHLNYFLWCDCLTMM